MPGNLSNAWFVYIIRCQSGKLYTGITTNVERRFSEHQKGSKGAKYTRADPPVAIEFVQQLDDRSAATKREIEIKKLSRAQKLALIVSSNKD